MKAAAFLLLLAICCIDCRKIIQINKNANIDFINMESGGGGARPVAQPASPAAAPTKPQTVQPEPPKPLPAQQQVPVQPTSKPVTVVAPTTPTPIKPQQSKPAQPNQMDLKPVPAKPAATGGATTPGYGNVKQLVTFYDSQGKASVIRPYSYSAAVKQG